MEKIVILTTINGKDYAKEVEPRLLLSDYIRHEVGLTGTHVGCEHGVCGACTVLLNGESGTGKELVARAQDLTMGRGRTPPNWS